jgi:hypothetical protein
MFFDSALLNGLVPFKDSSVEKFANGGAVPVSPISFVFVILLIMTFGFLYSYGAAKLSWNYNIHVGNSSGAAFTNSILAFIFSTYYYPLYALLLSPIGA